VLILLHKTGFAASPCLAAVYWNVGRSEVAEFQLLPARQCAINPPRFLVSHRRKLQPRISTVTLALCWPWMTWNCYCA